MSKQVKPIPDGYHSVTSYLIVKGAADALAFYKRAFDAEEIMRMNGPHGSIGHAEIKIGDSRVMLSDECPEMKFVGPQTLGGSPVALMLYVPDVDATFARAIAAGAKERLKVEDKFYGDRSGSLEDPFGHVWHIATHIEDVSEQELAERAKKFMESQS
ncbi:MULTISPECIES: VOC family protein [unclassified Hahella]|uniref:VOC family protein n=1 Tax=unclassified Hahella TaxID=2624107 RepID=UPI001C1EFA9E|nr:MULTISPECIES: VOC family protein [unclassified Hahella]MBU6952992.1 VOC family protein [Hahella sp. HN01]MDG9668686.1 VOC family protein [Hahella sp. CR1]